MPSPPMIRRRPARRAAASAALLIVGLLATTFWATPSEAAVPAAGTTYQMSVTKSGKCLDVVDGSKNSGALVQQWGCTQGAAWQQFTLKSTGTGLFTIVNANSGMCLDVPGGSTTSGIRLQQWGCASGQTNQQWRFVASGSGTYQIVSVAGGLCVSVQGASTTSGAAVIQETCTGNSNKQWLFTPVGTENTPTVAADGTGRHRTVQAAIDAVPSGNTGQALITIKAGTYREIVTIPADKPYITLRGLGATARDVVIVNNHSANTHGTSGSATAFVYGHDFTATNLTVSNDFDESSVTSGAQAVALHLNADRAVLRNVRLLGDQDTFLVNNSTRAYMTGSYVEGTVDFIFGGGTIVFDNCDVYEKRVTGGPVTAASTPADKKYGFLFYKSRISGAASAGTTHLGRPWRPDAQVLYRESTLGSLIKTAQPWTDMSGNSWLNARFLEYQNTGAGAGTNSNRPQLSGSQAADYTPQKYLAGTDGWNPVG